MITPIRWPALFLKSLTAGYLLLALSVGVAAEEKNASGETPVQGQRVFSAGHSFHMFVPAILKNLAQEAGITDHVQVGAQGIGGSRVIQHWDLPEDKNKAKAALATGEVDVLTLSPIYLPDEGIENFVKLAVEKNPQVRVLIQEFWLPFDVYAVDYRRQKPAAVDRNARTAEQLRKEWAPYFQNMDDHARALNKQLGKPTVGIVPVGQAVIALREKIIAGEAPGLKEQNDLFTDAIGHATPPLQALVAYCHYAVIYRRSPVGLPMPALFAKARNPAWEAKLNTLLQELAWEAAQTHPLSGVGK